MSHLKQIKRLNRISEIIESADVGVDKKNIDDIEKQIRKKYDKLKNYRYVDDLEVLAKGFFLQHISLDLEKTGGGVIANIHRNFNGIVDMITIKNLYGNNYWKVKPKKHYLFYIERGGSARKDWINQILKEYNIKMKK